MNKKISKYNKSTEFSFSLWVKIILLIFIIVIVPLLLIFYNSISYFDFIKNFLGESNLEIQSFNKNSNIKEIQNNYFQVVKNIAISINQLKLENYIIIIISIFLSLTLIIWIIYKVKNYIKLSSNALIEMQKHNYSYQLPVYHGDNFAYLVAQFNLMANGLKRSEKILNRLFNLAYKGNKIQNSSNRFHYVNSENDKPNYFCIFEKKNQALFAIFDLSHEEKSLQNYLFQYLQNQININYKFEEGSDLTNLCYKLDKKLSFLSEDDRFWIPAFLGLIDFTQNKLYYVNCGFQESIFFQKNSIELIKAKETSFIGFHKSYEQHEINFNLDNYLLFSNDPLILESKKGSYSLRFNSMKKGIEAKNIQEINNNLTQLVKNSNNNISSLLFKLNDINTNFKVHDVNNKNESSNFKQKFNDLINSTQKNNSKLTNKNEVNFIINKDSKDNVNKNDKNIKEANIKKVSSIKNNSDFFNKNPNHKNSSNGKKIKKLEKFSFKNNLNKKSDPNLERIKSYLENLNQKLLIKKKKLEK